MSSQPVSAPTYFTWQTFPFERPPEMSGEPAGAARHPVAIVGAGPVGLALSLNLARHGVGSVILEQRNQVSDGSRAVAMTRRTTQILDRIGVGGRVMGMADTWARNSTYYGTDLVYEMVLPHPPHEKHTPLTNLQQCWMEQIMVDEAAETGRVDIRWQSRIAGVTPHADHVALEVATPEGSYTLEADYVVACDGPRGAVRQTLGLRYEGATFEKRYIISDFHMKSDLPIGRRAWFDPPYSRGSTILMHKTPFDVWRLDYQLRDDEDPDEAQRPEVVRKRIADHLAMMGETAPWDLIWVSMYRAHALSLPTYDSGRVLFAGDAAHQVPIFGGRGLNHGYADTHNLAWKLAAAVQGVSPPSILGTYTSERRGAILDTIEDLTRITIYMTTPNAGVELMRDAVLSLSLSTDSVKQLFDPFRVTPYCHADSPLNGARHREAEFSGGPPAGLMAPDLPLAANGGGMADTCLYDRAGPRLRALYFAGDGGVDGETRSSLGRLADDKDVEVICVGGPDATGDLDARDTNGFAPALFAAAPGTAYLLRPDDYVAARWRSFDAAEMAGAIRTARGHA